MALDLAEAIYKVDVLEHLPGRANKWADAPSRLMQPGSGASLPAELQHAQRVYPQQRVGEWWRTAQSPSLDDRNSSV